MRFPVRRVLALSALALACSMAAPRPVAAGTQTLVCSGSVSETFMPTLTTALSTGVISVSMSTPAPLTCTGAGSASVTLSFSGFTETEATCAGPLAILGSGSITFSSPPGGLSAVTWVATGTPQAQSWAFLVPDAPAAAATAVLDTADATACVLSGSVSTVTLTAVLAIVVA